MIILLKLLQSLFWLIFRLPPAAAIRLMQLAGEITYQLARLTPARGMVVRNIALFFPKAEAGPLADKALLSAAYSIFEVLCVPFFNDSHFKLICRIVGRENIDLALVKRKGAVIATMHTGNYELLPIFLRSLGFKISSVMKAPPDPLFRFLAPIRSHGGTKLINVLEVDMYRETIKALGDNELVCLGIDTGALEGRHELFTFLGRKIPAATGWLTLAQRSEAAIIPAMVRRDGKKLLFSVGEPMYVMRDNREEIAHRIGQVFENFIKNHPEQWLMFLNEYETKRMVEGK